MHNTMRVAGSSYVGVYVCMRVRDFVLRAHASLKTAGIIAVCASGADVGAPGMDQVLIVRKNHN